MTEFNQYIDFILFYVQLLQVKHLEPSYKHCTTKNMNAYTTQEGKVGCWFVPGCLEVPELHSAQE